MSIKPVNGNVVIEPRAAEEVTESGIALPTTSTPDDQTTGMVVAVSKGSPVKVGDEVIYKKWSGEMFKEDGQQFVLTHEENLLAIVTS